MAETTEMLATLGSVNMSDWNSLPRLPDAGPDTRLKCSGSACRGVRVLKDSDSRVWLVLASNATNIVSLDENAAALAANMGWLAALND